MKQFLLAFVTILIACTFPLPALELSLEQALAMARGHSFALRRAELEIDVATASLEQARSDRLPEVTLRATSSYLTDPPEGISIEPGDLGYLTNPGSTYPVPLPDSEIVLVPDPDHTYFRVQLSTVWPIFTWGKLETAVRIAEIGVAVADASAERSATDLVRDVSKAYYGLKLAVESERVLTEMKSLYNEVVADRELAFDAGAANLESVLDARTQLQNIETQVAVAAEARRSAEAGLRYLVGTTDPIVPVDAWRETIPSLDVSEISAAARLWSPEVRTLDLQIRQASAFAKIQENSRLMRPDLAFAVGVEASGQRIPLSANWRNDWDIGVTLSIVADAVAWDWGKRDAAAREAYLEGQIATVGRDELFASVEVRVTQLVEAAVGADSQLTLKQAQVDLAMEREKNARVTYENELITREQYLGAQVLRLTAELEALVAGYAIESALLDLKHVSGRRLP